MTDYILSLDQIQKKFIDPETDEQKDLPEAFGLGAKKAPTVEKEVKELGNTTPATVALGTAYKYDDGDYGGEKYSYQIQPGDTLTKIAREAQMTIPELMKMNEGNPAIKSADLIYAGGNINLSKKVKTKAEILNYDTKPPAIFTEEGNVASIMYDLSQKYDLPFELVMAVGQKESGLNPYTIAGDAGTALGLMQVRGLALKDVNDYYGLNITRDEQNPKSKNYDIRKSIESGVAYLALQKEKYGAKTDEEMLAQYNGGPTGMKKKAARDYASSVLGLMKDVKPFDFGAKFTSGDRTPMGEIDSFAVGVDNTIREIKNSNLPNVDFGLLESAASYVKGNMPKLNISFTGDDLIGSVQEAIDIDSLKLEDTTKNTLSKISKTISEYADTPVMLKKKLAEAKQALTNLENGLTSFKDKFVEGAGEVTDKTLEALGSGASAESGSIGFSGQGEFGPALSGAAKKILDKIKGAGESVKEFFTVDPDKLVDLDGKGTMATRKEVAEAYKKGDILLGELINKKQKKERTIDEKMGVSLDNIRTAGFSLPFLKIGAAEASTPKQNEIDASLMLENDLDDSTVLNVLNKGWDAALDIIPSNVRLYVEDLLTPEALKGIKGEFTEKHLSKSYQNLLGNIAVQTLKDYPKAKGAEIGPGLSAPINYDDYKSKKSIETGDPYADVKYASKENIDLSDKAFNLKTSFGQAKATINDKGELIITDRFNFNDAKDVRSVSDLMQMVAEIGGAAARLEQYNFVRKVGKWFGSGEGEGRFVKINLGDWRQYANLGALDETKLPSPKPKGLGAKS
jgi:LysM repeat protein